MFVVETRADKTRFIARQFVTGPWPEAAMGVLRKAIFHDHRRYGLSFLAGGHVRQTDDECMSCGFRRGFPAQFIYSTPEG